MRRLLTVISLLLFVLLFGGCDLLDTVTGYNVFKAIDKPAIPTAEAFAGMTDDELLSSLDELTQSDEFYSELDDTTKTAILNELIDIVGDPDSLEDYQEAVILIAEIELKTTEAAQVIDSIIDILFDTGGGSGDFIEDLITAAFSDVPRAEFTETINAIGTAAAAYVLYGTSLTDLDSDGKVDAPPGSNIGAIAQDALISIVVASVVSELGATDVEQFVYDADPFDSVPTNPVDNPSNASYTALNNILEASGLDEALGG